jgi:hypothetical protein
VAKKYLKILENLLEFPTKDFEDCLKLIKKQVFYLFSEFQIFEIFKKFVLGNDINKVNLSLEINNNNTFKKENISEEFIKKTFHLISKHEVGGDEEQNALMDADSVSFFETNAEMFVNKKAPIEGYEKVKEKLDWMFNRISTEERKGVARENYSRWSKELEKYK